MFKVAFCNLEANCGRNEPRVLSNPIEFDGIKIRVVELLPYAKAFDRVPTSHRILDDVVGSFAVFVPRNVGQTDEIGLLPRQNGYGGSE
jgi:hypothetical protein